MNHCRCDLGTRVPLNAKPLIANPNKKKEEENPLANVRVIAFAETGGKPSTVGERTDPAKKKKTETAGIS